MLLAFFFLLPIHFLYQYLVFAVLCILNIMKYGINYIILKQSSSSSHQNVTCSCHEIAEKLVLLTGL